MVGLMVVVAFARKTGDIAVLSATDLSVIALTYQWEVAENGEKNIRTDPKQKVPVGTLGTTEEKKEEHIDEANELEHDDSEDDEEEGQSEEEVELAIDDVTRSIDQVLLDDKSTPEDSAQSMESPESVQPTNDSSPAESAPSPAPAPAASLTPLDEDEESDGGEWITPSNVNKHRSHDLGLLPAEGNAKESGPIAAACMTGDFAVQNVLLGMGMGLVGEGGKRISKVKSFVLRCHACFK
jgi:RNA-binding protein NOB1